MPRKVSILSDKGFEPESPSNGEGPSRFQVDRVGGSREGADNLGFNNNEPPPYNNQNTYVYDSSNPRRISQITREVRPNMDNYRNLMSVHYKERPGLEELHSATHVEKKKEAEDVEAGPVLKGKVVKFTWLEGVLMRCLLNIWGVMLFLRLSWCIGQAGLLEGLMLISLANLVTFITAFSMSAVSTNGQISAGGIYYMISRSLGPEFGAAIGLMFTVANSIAVSLHTIGFCESLNDLFKDYEIGQILDGDTNSIRVIGVSVLIAILILAFIGMDWVTRAQMFFLVVLIAAQVDFIVGSFIGPVDTEEKAKGFIGYNAKTFATNFWHDYRFQYGGGTTQQDFFSVFGVFFPSVTGIVAGANLSGDLKDPAGAIPKGTLLAITITYLSYVFYSFMMAGCAIREATGNVTQYELSMDENFTSLNPDFLPYDQCKDDVQECNYGLLYSAQVMELISSWGPLIYCGCFAATLSSAIASLVGAPRVLQALAKDKLYPGIHFFAAGYGANNDPVRGYILVFIISLGCILIAQLNAIAPIQSNFFLMAYCLINFSCFHATVTRSPGWRPAFKYYNAWVSLAGCVLCIVVMFLLSWYIALATVGCVTFLYLYVKYRKPDVNWGSSTQAQSYNSALSSVQDLNRVEEHVKNYRPQVLILSGMPSARPPLIDFGYLIVKNLSLLVCGHVVKDRYSQRVRGALQRHAYSWLQKHKKKGFYTLIEDDNFERGCRAILQTSGLGKLRPDTVLLGYKSDWRKANRQSLKDYFSVINEVLSLHLSLAILRTPRGLDYTGIVEEAEHEQIQQLLLDVKKKSKAFADAHRVAYLRNLSEDGLASESEQESPQLAPKTDKERKISAKQNQPLPSVEEATSSDKKKKNKDPRRPSALYQGPGGVPLARDILADISHFSRKQKKGYIDVWWLYDDGGLTLLIPYIISTRYQFAGCTIRVFALASNNMDDLGLEHRNMAALLSKFRIDYSEVVIISDIQKKAQESTKKEFDALIQPFLVNPDSADDETEAEEGTKISQGELIALRERTNRHLRLSEELQARSKESTFVVMTLPMPRKGTVSAPLYMAWLEMMTRNMPPFLVVRGNQTSVLTYYS